MLSHLHGHAAELKSQGAVEAAQNPESNVKSQDAQHVMAAESKKAGVAAFEFDPDASPEAKAAQARSVCRSIDSLDWPLITSVAACTAWISSR